jgi:D-xylose transport system substrate-binding protein
VKKLVVVFAAALAAVGVVAAGATAKHTVKQAGAEACVLLPDTKSSVRWEQFDRPAFAAAFKAAGITSTIVNALNDPQKQKSQADQCLANGAKVLVITSLDAGSSIAIQKAAAAKGAKTIDYDREIVGGTGALYVSFDNPYVGKLQGQGVVAGLKANGKYSQHPVVAELNGGPTDNNAFLFKSGYDSILKPLYKNGTFKAGPDQFVPQWDNQQAGTIFAQMLVKTGNKIDAVAAANDGLANAVVVQLKAHKLKPIPLSGQDATPQGVQNIISGWQTMTVYKDVRLEAKAAAKAAIQLVKGQKLTTTGTVPNGKK